MSKKQSPILDATRATPDFPSDALIYIIPNSWRWTPGIEGDRLFAVLENGITVAEAQRRGDALDDPPMTRSVQDHLKWGWHEGTFEIGGKRSDTWKQKRYHLTRNHREAA